MKLFGYENIVNKAADQTTVMGYSVITEFPIQDSIPLLDFGMITTFNTIPWTEFLALSYLIFLIGLSGIIFNFKNFLVTMFSIELMYLGITISFILVSVASADPKGQIYAMVLLILAAAESAIGLGILIVLFRFGKSIDFESYQELRG
jgi:NADH-quinone oxidoreductase subunit K